MITSNVWERVVQIRCGRAIGTGFTLDRGSRQYLVTAAHVVEGGGSLQVLVRGKATKTSARRLAVSAAGVDVAVFEMSEPITPPGLPLPAALDGFTFGQEAYFLGFPRGLHFDIGNGEFFGLVKRSTISGFGHVQGRGVLLLDGWANRGFSGGPVVFQPVTSRGVQEPFQVCGVVSGYKHEKPEVRGILRRFLESRVLMNTGIIVAEEISWAVEAINKQPAIA